ncbi:aluminum-activated malate transporter 10-like [Populus nigra]|uniref:aluminum-activated malate transporter 10-like n=1 Tax=Populus nigra TaxID=3691 RepID=UPI002B2683E2|nr:aluminum-activated malate transporter 10-like [Populus nigra]
MVMGNRAPNKLEWRIHVRNGTSEILQPETGLVHRIWSWLKGLLGEFMLKIWNFLEKARNIAVAEPKKVIHCLKVAVTLTIVSLFYYMRPLYEGVGGNAMWAIMTVVVVFEYTVGATLYKCINRAIGTFLAGSLGVGVHWAASHSGDKLEPIILGISVFLLGELESVPKTDFLPLRFFLLFSVLFHL